MFAELYSNYLYENIFSSEYQMYYSLYTVDQSHILMLKDQGYNGRIVYKNKFNNSNLIQQRLKRDINLQKLPTSVLFPTKILIILVLYLPKRSNNMTFMGEVWA